MNDIDLDDAVLRKLGQFVRCAIENNLSLHRFPLAPDQDRYMFNGYTAGTLEEAHRFGCPKCCVPSE